MDKPNALQLGIACLESQQAGQHMAFTVRRDLVRWPDGAVRPYSYLEGPPVVFIVPVTHDGQIVLIREFRYTVDAWVWEVPAGGAHDFHGDDLAELARQELAEEVGGTAAAIVEIGQAYYGTGLTSKILHIFLATGVEIGASRPEATELIEVHPTSLQRALEMARSGEIASGLSAYALLRCEPVLNAWLRTRTLPQGATLPKGKA